MCMRRTTFHVHPWVYLYLCVHLKFLRVLACSRLTCLFLSMALLFSCCLNLKVEAQAEPMQALPCKAAALLPMPGAGHAQVTPDEWDQVVKGCRSDDVIVNVEGGRPMTVDDFSRIHHQAVVSALKSQEPKQQPACLSRCVLVRLFACFPNASLRP